jgi:hypothetical protein
MKPIRAVFSSLMMVFHALLLTLGIGITMSSHAHGTDVLAVGDLSDNSVRFFSSRTGKLLQSPLIEPGSGGLRGPMGILFDAHRKEWIVANQNIGQPFPGEILRYDASGRPLGALVARTDPDAPFAPRGIVFVKNRGSRVLFVADLGDVGIPGKLLAYRVTGTRASLIANLDPNLKHPGTTGPFHPRGIVLGPDGYLYVSIRNLPGPCGGSIVRFDPKKLAFKDILMSNPVDCKGNINDLHRPEGLVFSPRGDLYVTSFQKDPSDTDKILIISKEDRRKGKIHLPLDRIDLYAAGEPRAFAQALLFGPHGNLFVPITNTGEVRRYNVDSKAYWTFVPVGRGLGAPAYLSFARTNPATLAYDD